MADKIFVNDKLVDSNEAVVSISDSGFLYGAGLFETMRSLNGKVFCLNDHLDRLFFSINDLSINNTYEKSYIEDAIYNTLEANGLKNARIRLTLTSGAVSQDGRQVSTLIIAAVDFEPYPAQLYDSGILTVISPYRQNTNDPACGHKTLSYFPRMLALDFARKYKAAEALWFTTDNKLAEGCISNIFIVKDSVIYTPSLSTPVLAGVARKAVCKTAIDNSIKLVEKDLYINDLLDADEVFITNVIMQVMPVAKIEKHIVGEGEAGPITKKLQIEFDKFVKQNCGT